MYKIMFSAGEVSGDLHGARLAEAIRKKQPDAVLFGFGGAQMAAAGVRLAADMADYSVMGFWEVFKNLQRLFRLREKLTAVMAAERPDLLVLIDYPDFNWRLAKRAKKLGIPVLSYIPPSAWAWRQGRARDCAGLADEFLAIFPFETKVYEAAGANISFIGNPLVDTVRPALTPEAARRYFAIETGQRPVLLLPGSRRQEISLLLPVMLQAAAKIQTEYPAAVFFLPVAQGLDRQPMEAMAADAGVAVRFTTEHTYDLMGCCELAIATSGTVVLEAALMGLPCIVLYRLSPVSYCIGRLLVHVKYFSLPNILAGREIQPELLQSEVNPERILKEARRFLSDTVYASTVREQLERACRRLGEPDAAGRAADHILAAAARSRQQQGNLSGESL